MPGRKYGTLGRYGFNGKENDNDNEVTTTSTYDYGFRVYNSGLGRFLSVDPLTQKFPELTPFQFASNSPVDGLDIDGLEFTSSKSPKIFPYIQYEPELKKITEVTTSLIYQNFIGYSRSKLLPKYGPPGADWQTYTSNLLIEFAKVSFDIDFHKDVESQVMPKIDATQALVEVESTGKSFVYTSPAVNSASKKFSRQTSSQHSSAGIKVNNIEFSGGDKLGASLVVVGLTAVGVAAIISNEEFSDAKRQSNFVTGVVTTKINNWLDKIPEKFKNSSNLSEIAQYLLNGEEPKMKTAAGSSELNKELMEIGKSIWAEIETDLKQLNREKNISQRQNFISRPAGDNTLNNSNRPH